MNRKKELRKQMIDPERKERWMCMSRLEKRDWFRSIKESQGHELHLHREAVGPVEPVFYAAHLAREAWERALASPQARKLWQDGEWHLEIRRGD